MASVNTEDINLISYEITFGGESLGLTTNGTTQISVNGSFIEVNNVEQLRGLAKLWRSGWEISVTTEMKDTSLSKISELAFPGELVETSGGKTAYYIGNKIVDLNDFAQELRLHPVGFDVSNTELDWTFFQALFTAPVELAGSNEDHQTLSVTFRIIPDGTKNSEKCFGVFGNWEISQTAPKGVWIGLSERVQVPALHIPATTLEPGSADKLEGFEGDGDSSGETAAINQGAGLLANRTDTSIPYDTLTAANAVVTGDYIQLGGATGEVMFVTDVVISTTTTGTITATRGVWGTTVAVHADSANIDILENPNVLRITQSTASAWASDDATDVTVGDTFSSSTNDKGLISHVSSGTADITVTFGTVSSPAITVTSN